MSCLGTSENDEVIMIRGDTLRLIEAAPKSGFDAWLEETQKKIYDFTKLKIFEQTTQAEQLQGTVNQIIKQGGDNNKVTSLEEGQAEPFTGLIADIVVSSKASEEDFLKTCESLGIFSSGKQVFTLESIPSSVKEELENRMSIGKRIKFALNEFAETMSNLCGDGEATVTAVEKIFELAGRLDEDAVNKAKSRIEAIQENLERKSKSEQNSISNSH